MDFMKLVISGRLYNSVAIASKCVSYMSVSSSSSLQKMSSCEEMINIQLVREVEKHPLLYNYRLPDYSKREHVEAAWNDIAEVMNDEAINCKEKWRNLRTVFVRKLKPLPAGAIKRKSYYLGDAMAFLTPFIKLQKSEDLVESPTSPEPSESENVTFYEDLNHNEYDSHGVGDNSSNQPESSNQMMTNSRQPSNYEPRRAAKKRAIETKDFTESFSEYVEPKRDRYSDPDDSRKYFLLSLLPEVQKLTNNQMKFFRRKMLDALDEAESYPAYNRSAGLFGENSNSQYGANGVTYFHEYSPKREC